MANVAALVVKERKCALNSTEKTSRKETASLVICRVYENS